ncbi:MAG TPA: hypothetical protein PKO15_18340 [Fibrobacteria bacterium]|nr:hypothetical protein [Fibrobacteria bacterium]HOX53798.1 hypothetical protein [Fibrobacteria bacterium]
MNVKLLSLPVRLRLEASHPELWTLALFIGMDLFQVWRSSSEIPVFVVAFAMASHRFAVAKLFRALREEAQAWREARHPVFATATRWMELLGSAAVAVFLVWFLGVV